MNTSEYNVIERCEKNRFFKKIVDCMENNPKTG